MSGVPAAREVLAILRYLSRQPRPVQASAIARDLALPRSTTYHLLSELAAAGFVVHLADDRRYALGVSAYELGTGYVRQAPLQRLARVPLSALTDATGHSSHLAVMHGREVLYVIEERAPGRAPLVTDVGVRLPAQLTASGRAMLAALPAASVRALFPGPAAFVLRTDRGPRNLRELRALLAEVRRRGYATEDGDVTPGLRSVAAAVLDHAGYPEAGVAVTFPADTDDAAAARIAARVVAAAAGISRRIRGEPAARAADSIVSVRPYLLVQLSDIHLTTSGIGPHGARTRDNLLAALREAAAAGLRPDVFLLTGDLADVGEGPCYDDLADILADAARASGAPGAPEASVVYLPGNHDDRDEFRRRLEAATAPSAAPAPRSTRRTGAMACASSRSTRRSPARTAAPWTTRRSATCGPSSPRSPGRNNRRAAPPAHPVAGRADGPDGAA